MIAISMFALSISTLYVFGIWLTYLKIHLSLLFTHFRAYLSHFRIILHCVYEITSNPIMNSHHYHFITRVLKFQASHNGFSRKNNILTVQLTAFV